jgi:hypothetical protein
MRDRDREYGWSRTWWLTSVLLFVAIGGAELAWRSGGHRPSVVDDLDLWSLQRSRIGDHERTVALVGNSRMQLGFASDVFRDRFPDHRLVRLEAPLRHTLSALRDLAEDADFRGVVIASVAAPWLRRGIYPDLSEEIDHYRRHFNWNAATNRHVASFIQARLASVNPNLNLREVALRRVKQGQWPDPLHVVTHTDRARLGDFRRHSKLEQAKNYLAVVTRERERTHHLSPVELLEQLAEIEPLVAQIRARGGRVAFVRFPSSGRIRRIDEKQYPKREYWDRFAARTAAPTLHYLDVPSLAEFECPDGIHLDERDAPRFTGLLLDELARMQVLPATR